VDIQVAAPGDGRHRAERQPLRRIAEEDASAADVDVVVRQFATGAAACFEEDPVEGMRSGGTGDLGRAETGVAVERGIVDYDLAVDDQASAVVAADGKHVRPAACRHR